MIFLLLYAAVGYLVLTSIILGLNLRDFMPLAKASQKPAHAGAAVVSVCIPARNEQRSIKRAVNSVLEQTYKKIEIVVLDDQSTDQTPAILTDLKKKYPERIVIISGKEKPEDWLGKSWACHQLSKQAKGEILFFIDADVWLKPTAVARALASMNYYATDFITVWPMQKLGSFWEQAVIPLVYYGLLTLLPSRYLYQNPGWLPSFINDTMAPKFAAACGQCMVFRWAAYEEIGGHQSVKNEIVEDVALAKAIKSHGKKMRMFHGKGAVWCRMYQTGSEMWKGFRKNFLALFSNSVPVFIAMVGVNFVVYVLPFIIFFFGLFEARLAYFGWAGVAVLLIVLQRLILARWFEWDTWTAFLHPIGVLWFHALAAVVLKDHFNGTRASWKERPTI